VDPVLACESVEPRREPLLLPGSAMVYKKQKARAEGSSKVVFRVKWSAALLALLRHCSLCVDNYLHV
jgi:hypothetical protein